MLLELIRGDIARYRESHGRDVWFHKGLWAVVDYRVGHWARTSAPKPLRPALILLTLLWRKLVIEIATGIGIEPHAQIGRRFYIAHFGAIFIHEDVVIGDGCMVAQGVTIGRSDKGAPVLADRVEVFPGAMVFGPVLVGDGAKIGAGALVFSDVPAGATAVGVPPARVIPAGG